MFRIGDQIVPTKEALIEFPDCIENKIYTVLDERYSGWGDGQTIHVDGLDYSWSSAWFELAFNKRLDEIINE